MHQIVIPVDEDEMRATNAAEFVIEMLNESKLDVDPANISVSVINVFKEFNAIDDGGNVKSKDLYDEDELSEPMVTVRDLLVEADISVNLERRHGDPADEIVEYAASIDADVIVLSGRKRSPVGKAMFGSVTQDVILDSDRPITIV